MNFSETELSAVTATSVRVNEDSLTVDLNDGRTIVVPLPWFPRLLNGTAAERSNFRLVGKGRGVHWPDLDEDISIEGLLAGRRSGETQRSLLQWLSSRDTLTAISRQIAKCLRPGDLLKVNITLETVELDAVVESQESGTDVIIEVKHFPGVRPSGWLTTVRDKLSSGVRAYQQALSRRPRILLIIVLRSDEMALEREAEEAKAFLMQEANANLPLRIEILKKAAITTLTCDQIRSLLFDER